jgi:hypothetical protein
MILDYIRKNPGCTYTQIRAVPSIRAAYSLADLSEKIQDLADDQQIYRYTNSGRIKLFIYDNEWRCISCNNGLPLCMPHIRKVAYCRSCAIKINETQQSELNEIMACWAKRPIFGLPTTDPRGYYTPSLS